MSKIKATRVEAMKWWNTLSTSQRVSWSTYYYYKRDHTSLTGFEIQAIYEKNKA